MKDYSLRNEKSKLIHATALSLHKHITELFENGYDQGYADAKSELGKKIADIELKGIDKAYQQGLEDAWKFVKNIFKSDSLGGYSYKMLIDIFGVYYVYDIVQKYTPQDAIRMIKEYEERKQDTEIKVGDEVDYHGDRYIVTLIANGDNTYTAISADGSHILRVSRDDIIATGRHFDQIAEVLAERGDKEC